jgi:hypothetical protein
MTKIPEPNDKSAAETTDAAPVPSKDELLEAGPQGAVELAENELDKAAGGFFSLGSIAIRTAATLATQQDVYVNKVKTSDKQQKAMLDFIKG